ncbi:putative threonine-rich GPI-anchored glycoprotein PJ4664.02-like [Arapaima gigas]
MASVTSAPLSAPPRTSTAPVSSSLSLSCAQIGTRASVTTPCATAGHTAEDSQRSALQPSRETIVFFTVAPKVPLIRRITFSHPTVMRATIMVTPVTLSSDTVASSPPVGAKEAPGTLALQFKLKGVFYPSYLNSDSTDYLELAGNITEEVGNILKLRYRSTFTGCVVNRLWNGTVGVDMSLMFRSLTAVPSGAAVESAMEEALRLGQCFLQVVPGSIVTWESIGRTETGTSQNIPPTQGPSVTALGASEMHEA